VVAVHLGEEWLILDNSTLIMANANDARHYRPLFVLAHRSVDVVGFSGVGDDLQTRPADLDLSRSEEAMRWACQSKTEKERQAYIELGRTWTQAALHSERPASVLS
jgi:hypothetical protein